MIVDWVQHWDQSQGFWAAVQGVATLIAAVAALVALFIAKSQLSELIRSNKLLASSNDAMTQSNLALTRPYVVIDFELTPSIGLDGRVNTSSVCVRIENVGRTPAKNLRMKVDHPFAPAEKPDESGWELAVTELNRVMDGQTVIKSLTHIRPLKYYLDEAGDIMGSDDAAERPWTVTASYEDSDGHKFEETTTLELRHWRLAMIVTDPLVRISKMVQSVANEIKQK